MFDTKLHKYTVMGYEKIVDDPVMQKKVVNKYGLPSTAVWESDLHYQFEDNGF